MFGLFYEKAFGEQEYILRVGDVKDIISQLGEVNDWMHLVNEGMAMGTKRDQPKLKKLYEFLTTCEDRKTLENFKLKISTGEFGCKMCAETEEELKRMREIVLAAQDIDAKYHKKINALFDRLITHLNSGENDSVIFNKISNRQYIITGISCDDYVV